MLKIGILPGDDIGLEVVPEAVKVMTAAAKKSGLAVEWSEHPIGRRGHELHGHTMPQVTVDALEKTDGFLCGPIGHNVLFQWLGRKRGEEKATRAAQLVDMAMDKVIAEAKHLTADLGGKASTSQMGDAVAAAI